MANIFKVWDGTKHVEMDARNSDMIDGKHAGVKADNVLVLDGSAKVPTANLPASVFYSHPTGDGNLHVPATGTSSNGKVLRSGATAGSLVWSTLTPSDVGALPASHDAKGVTSAKIGNWDAAFTHSELAHAPSNAQKNSDITKAEIEAKLKGVITSHTHEADTNKLDKNAGIVAGTSTKITYDAKGLVTAGGSLTASDIPTLNLSKISDSGTVASKNTGTASGNIPILGTGGKLDVSVIPSIAITDTFVVADEAAMLALKVETGDVAIRSDLNKSFILQGTDPKVKGNWQELLTPTDTVLSVNGKKGEVTLNATDVGLGNVTNESKSSMLTNTSLLGIPTAPTAVVGTNTTQIATTAFVKSQNYLTANDKITVSGDATGSGTTSISLSLKNSGVTAGTYKSVTVDAKGRVTEATNPTTLSGFGITDAAPSSHIGSTGTAHGIATSSVNGFMSAKDKKKIDAVSEGANKVSFSDIEPTGVSIGDIWVSEESFA